MSARVADVLAGMFARFGLGPVRVVPLLCVLSTAMGGLVSCGAAPSATLEINAPASVVAGVPFTVTVTATANGRRDTIIDSIIVFSSSDRSAVFPPYYVFTTADAGSHTFTNGFTLMTVGSQSIKAAALQVSSINGIANVTVSAATTTTTEF